MYNKNCLLNFHIGGRNYNQNRMLYIYHESCSLHTSSTTDTYVDSNTTKTPLSETNIILISGLVLCFFVFGAISVVFFCLYRKKSAKTEVIVREVFLPMDQYQYDELDDDITTQTETHQEQARPSAAVDDDYKDEDYQEDDYQDDDYKEDDDQDDGYQEEERGTYYTYYDEEGNFVRTYSSS